MKSRCRQGHALSDSWRGPSLPLCSLWWSLAIFGMSSITATQVQSAFTTTRRDVCPCLRMVIFLESYCNRGLPTPGWPHLNQPHLQWPDFKIRWHSEMLRIRPSAYLSSGGMSRPIGEVITGRVFIGRVLRIKKVLLDFENLIKAPIIRIFFLFFRGEGSRWGLLSPCPHNEALLPNCAPNKQHTPKLKIRHHLHLVKKVKYLCVNLTKLVGYTYAKIIPSKKIK